MNTAETPRAAGCPELGANQSLLNRATGLWDLNV